MELEIGGLNELSLAAAKLLDFASTGKVFLFEGDMGAGKTTLIKALCEELGMADNASSPTYSIVNEYRYPDGKIYHFDFFRIKNEGEAYDIGFEEYLYSGEYCFIEWPERIQSLWPETYIEVSIHQTENEKRILKARKI